MKTRNMFFKGVSHFFNPTFILFRDGGEGDGGDDTETPSDEEGCPDIPESYDPNEND